MTTTSPWTRTPRVAAITGSSRGLGRALAAAFLEAGFAVAINGRDPEALAATRAWLAERFDPEAIAAIAGDVSTAQGAAAFIAGTTGAFGRLDVLINNAGTLGPGGRPAMSDLDPEALLEILRVNAVGPVRVTREALPWLTEHRGVVINVTSDAAAEGYPGWGGYGASKAALELLGQSWAEELRSVGVRIHAVNPGDLNTDMHQEAFPGEDISDRLDPASVTGVFVWLASVEAADLTRQRFDAPQWAAS